AQRDPRAAHWFLAGAIARPAQDAGAFSRPICSPDGFGEFSFAFDAALRRVGAAGIPAPLAILRLVSPFTCGPRSGRDHSASTCGLSAEFRSSSVLPGFVEHSAVAPFCRTISRRRSQRNGGTGT